MSKRKLKTLDIICPMMSDPTGPVYCIGSQCGMWVRENNALGIGRCGVPRYSQSFKDPVICDNVSHEPPEDTVQE